jgi:hypothetical protein
VKLGGFEKGGSRWCFQDAAKRSWGGRSSQEIPSRGDTTHE